MILEIATLDVKAGQSAAFASAFRAAQEIIASMQGYISHELQCCLERPDRHVLLVKWRRLEDHTEGFRQSPRYAEWRGLLHHFYATAPLVEHFHLIEPQRAP
jgi:heme-degrading monooxygenase HmoA